MLVPRVELLDGRRRELRKFSYKDMKSMGESLVLTVFIKPDFPHSRYVLLYPDPALTGRVSEHLDQSMSMAFYGLYSVPYGISSKSVSMDVERGTLQVRVVRYSTPHVKRVGRSGRHY